MRRLTPAESPVLEVDGLGVNYGGLRALTDVSITIRESSIAGIIGPNGAGKSTLFNVISGYQRPSKGGIRYRGEQIVGKSPVYLARQGIGRTFQTPCVCKEMTVLENALCGGYTRIAGSPISQVLGLRGPRRSEKGLVREAESELEHVGLWEDRFLTAGGLPFGKVRMLEIVRALLLHPSILLLDEAASGLNSTETQRLAETIKQMGKRDITVILIEHNIGFVMSLVEQLIVLQNGSVLRNGDPQEVRTDERVIEAYMGRRKGT